MGTNGAEKRGSQNKFEELRGWKRLKREKPVFNIAVITHFRRRTSQHTYGSVFCKMCVIFLSFGRSKRKVVKQGVRFSGHALLHPVFSYLSGR